eukprot:12203546-Karenia_brevis.AAC.1
MAYADGLIVIGKNLVEIESMIADLKRVFKSAGLAISTERKKNLCMLTAHAGHGKRTSTESEEDGPQDGDELEIKLGGIPFHLVETLPVLGCKVSSGDAFADEIDHRIDKANAAFFT